MRKKIPVVPMYVFGSSDFYFTSNAFYNLRYSIMKKFAVCITFSSGFWGSFCPFPVDTTIVCGKPLDLFKGMKGKEPTEEELNAAHKKFCDALRSLFDEHKHQCGYGDRQLIMM